MHCRRCSRTVKALGPTAGEDFSSGRARSPGCMRDLISCSNSSRYLCDCSPLTLVAASACMGWNVCDATKASYWDCWFTFDIHALTCLPH